MKFFSKSERWPECRQVTGYYSGYFPVHSNLPFYFDTLI